MSHAFRRTAGAPLLLLASLILVAAAVVAGCGGGSGGGSDGGSGGGGTADVYSGTWTQSTTLPGTPNVPITITRSGDEYALTGPDGATSTGYLLHTDPSDAGEVTIYSMVLEDTKATEEGDHLTFPSADNTVEITVSGDTMTMVVSGVDGDFTFERGTP